ncbi:MAG: glycosyltransferase family 4 protein [Rhodospirillaceae bacterium]|nr:glycosyltransferase family 4 protein [Rhodospirillaceae bacterium]
MPDTPHRSFPRKIFYSARVNQALFRSSPNLPLGAAHYSHALLGARLLKAFASLGIETQELVRPEIYHSDYAWNQLGRDEAVPIHLIFKPIEEVRFLRGAYNILCSVWEYDKINTEPLDHPFSDHLSLVSRMDEIWCYSHYTKRALAPHVANVHRVPAPFVGFAGPPSRPAAEAAAGIPCCYLDRPAFSPLTLGDVLAEFKADPQLFLSVTSPTDLRKNLATMLAGFAQFVAGKTNALLIVKCIVPADPAALETTYRSLRERFRPHDLGRIVIICDYLPQERLDALYASCGFFVCTSHCEGLCMPLIEAMSFGLIPVSVDNTAMNDYISNETAHVIRSTKVRANPASNSSGNPFLNWYASSPEAVALALERAYAEGPDRREARRAKGREILDDRFSLARASEFVATRLRAIAGSAVIDA